MAAVAETLGFTQDRDLPCLDLLQRYLAQCRRDKVSGKLTLELELRDGGVMDKYVTVRRREK